MNPFRLRFTFFLTAVFVTASISAGTVRVKTVEDLRSSVAAAKPGDRIIVANGKYVLTEPLIINVQGSENKPVTIEAGSTGGAEFTGPEGIRIIAPSSRVVIKGFVFTHKSGRFRVDAGATHCVITGNVFECVPDGNGSKPYLSISGDDNEVSYNTFRNKKDEGQMLSIQGPGGDRMAKNVWIHHNWFHDFPNTGLNNCSAIQIGLSGRSMDSAFCVVEYNLFERTEGENEGAICHKSCSNIIRFNTFGERSEECSIRHGNKSQVYGNFFINTTGLRFSGDDHLIYGNYFLNCTKAIVCQNGDGEVKEGSKLTCHDRADRVTIAGNAIIDCKASFQMPSREGGLGATGIVFTENLIRGGSPVSVRGSYPGAVWKNNIIWNTEGGDMPASGYTLRDQNIPAPGGFLSGPSTLYPVIPSTNRPLEPGDVGPRATFAGKYGNSDYPVASPDGKISCKISAGGKGITMSVDLEGRMIIDPSPLTISLNGKTITNTVKTGKIARSRIDETYELAGLHSRAKNLCNTLSLPLTDLVSGQGYTLEIRVFNNAAAFRFVIPGDENTTRYPDESTIFRIPGKSTCWFHDLYMHYEGVHAMKLIDTIPEGEWAAPPLTFRLAEGAGFASITEANLVNYAGMALQSDGRNGFALRLGQAHPASYPYILRYSKDDVKRLSDIAGVKGTITTPWRVIIAGKDLNTLVNSDAVNSLCPAPDPKYFPEGSRSVWVKPGRAVWKYLDGGGDGTLTVMKKFSREAADLGFEYNILEGFWSRWPEDSLKALVDYSAKLGVRIIVWKHSNTLHDPVTRKELIQKCHDLGIAGLKIDFFDHEAKEVTDLYETILRETAQQKLICIFHGANKPTGLWRTWPNAMIYEAVKGMEASKLTDRATHETTIPFTRMLAGPADYSVCHFGTRRQNTTWVHQAATAAIYCAPIITYAATPAHILENPCSDMIRSIPAVWDETIVLPPSEIGELALFAQRKGKTWFLSAINGLTSKSVSIPLMFLGNARYKSLILKDNPANPADAVISREEASGKDVINIELSPGGGFMCRFDPE